MAAQLENMVTHGELTIEQIAHIQKNILVFLRKDTFWDKFCSHSSIPAGQSSVEWRKLNVPELDPADVADLTEGVTPAALQMEYVKFSVSPVDYGSWIGYTDKSKRYNYDDVVRDAKTVLAQRARDEAEIRKANVFLSGTCTMSLTDTSNENAFLKDLLKARTILIKNHIKPISGNKYGCILTPEQAADVLVTYQSSITHTSQKEAIINGYLGELGGFILFECGDEVMYVRDETNNTTDGYCLFIGKSEYGMPVQTLAFGDASVAVYDNGLGSVPQYDSTNGLRPDALHQRGSVGYKVMGFAARIIADEAIIRATYSISTSSSEGDVSLDVDDADRTHYEESETSPAD